MGNVNENSSITEEEIIKASKEHIIVALDDLESLEEVRKMVRQLRKYVDIFKVGLELINRYGGPKIVEVIHKLGGKVFYDGKFNDKPSVLRRTAKLVSDLGVFMMSVHASAGREAMRAVFEGVTKGNNHDLTKDSYTRILAVTILTSLKEADTRFIFGTFPRAKVLDLAELASLECLDGIICSPHELTMLNENKGYFLTSWRVKSGINSSYWRITPGIRPTWYSSRDDDQMRSATPYEAIMAGSTYLVIGKPILQPPKKIGTPLKAIRLIGEEVARALKDLKKR